MNDNLRDVLMTVAILAFVGVLFALTRNFHVLWALLLLGLVAA